MFVSTFFEQAKSVFDIELVVGEDWMESKRIIEAAINRPGLALTGFYEYFAFKRIQILGHAEDKYLDSLSKADKTKRLDEFFSSKIPCVVVARNKKVSPEMIKMASKYKVPVFKTKMITKNFINAATILMESMMAPYTMVQGTMIELMGIGVLIDGKPGMGKSDTALSLVRRGASLVADDITKLRVDSLSGLLFGSAVDVTRYHMEIKGVGIIHVPSLFGVASVRSEKKLNLVIELCSPEEIDDRLATDDGFGIREMLGVEVPSVKVGVISGRDISNVVEVATLNYKLKLLGHDAAKELDARIMNQMTAMQAGGS
ncbi:HPr(Ser) kinase/phosphatase [bacterium E08(2017)]|nr:HPr(Ser) kinase/phosphatase [bacterium E08(2017)]